MPTENIKQMKRKLEEFGFRQYKQELKEDDEIVWSPAVTPCYSERDSYIYATAGDGVIYRNRLSLFLVWNAIAYNRLKEVGLKQTDSFPIVKGVGLGSHAL